MLPNGRLAPMLLTAIMIGSSPAMGQQPNESSAVTHTGSAQVQREDSLLSGLRQMGFGALHTVPLDQAESPALRIALDELFGLHGFVPTSLDAVILLGQQNPGTTEVWLVELEQAMAPDSRLFLYYLPSDSSIYFLRVEIRGDSAESVRIWGTGLSELVMSHDGIAMVDGPSNKTFRLRSPYGNPADKGAADTIACLGRQLGITPTPTGIGNIISQSTCGATNILTLALTTYNCLSIPHPISTIGCVVGVSKLVSCGFANCSSPTGTATVEWTISDGCADSRGFNARIFDRTRGGFYPPGGSYTVPSGSSRLFRFSAPRGSQLCIGAQTSPPTSGYWCVGFNGNQSPNYPGAGTSLCCATVPNSGKLVKSNRLTCN
jgi:hypothetical protein